MTKRKSRRRLNNRLGHIEIKCDRILSELMILHRRLTGRVDIDSAIDILHRSARNMRNMAERERDLASKMFHSINGE